MDQKKVGIIVMILSTLSLLFFFYYSSLAEGFILDESHLGPEGECLALETGKPCPFQTLQSLVFPKYVTIISLLSIFIYGLFLRKTVPKPSNIKTPKDLDEEEQKIFDLIKDSEGAIYQSDIVSKTEWSKVKVTRILDKLEHKNIIERRRRGMTNIIMLK